MSQIGGATVHPFHHSVQNFQNTNAPDIDLERDLIGGMVVQGNAQDRKKDTQFRYNLATIVISAVLFLAILAWYDFIQTAFYTWLEPESQTDQPSFLNKFYYALLATGFSVAITLLIIFYPKLAKRSR